MSVPIQKARVTLIAHPNEVVMMLEQAMAQGTAVAAFEASSLICTLASNAETVHNGVSNERMNANPSGQPYTAPRREVIETSEGETSRVHVLPWSRYWKPNNNCKTKADVDGGVDSLHSC